MPGQTSAPEPYIPVQEVAPQLAPARNIDVRTSSAAFGGDIAQAVSGLGRVTKQGADEMFQRARAMQQLNNETQARQASVAFEAKAGQSYAAFKNQYGNNAGPDALVKFQNDLTDMRDGMKSQLNNPQAQGLYDADSSSIMGRLFVYGASHSADQLKQVGLASRKAVIEEANNTVQLKPIDDSGFVKSRATAMSQAQALGEELGESPAEIAQNVAIAKSKITSTRISALAETSPITAQKMLDEARTEGDLRGEDITSVQRVVDRQLVSIGSSQIVKATQDGSNLQLGQSIVPIAQASAAIGGPESAGNGGYAAIQKTTGALGKYQVKPSSLPGMLREAGLPPMTPQQYVANHQAQETLFAAVFGGYMKKYGNFNEAAAKWFTGKSLSEGADPNVRDVNENLKAYLANANAALSKASTPEQFRAAAAAAAERIAPANVRLSDTAQSKLAASLAHTQTIARVQTNQDMNTIHSAMANAVTAAPHTGVEPTVETLTKDPAIKAAYDRLPADQQYRLQKTLEKMGATDNVDSSEREAEFNKLRGMSYVDSDNFNKADIGAANLTMSQKKTLLADQKKTLAGHSLATPAVTLAMKDPTLLAALKSANVDLSKTDDTNLQFRGAFATMINEYEQSGAPLSSDKLRELGMSLLRGSPGGWFSSSVDNYTMFKPVTQAQIDSANRVNAAHGRQQQTVTQIQQEQNRRAYDTIVGTKQ